MIDCELKPRIATERLDSGEVRLGKILECIRESRYSIHDLSRVQALAAGDFARLNMPFELGVDFGYKLTESSEKRLLVIAEDQYKYQAALSDIAGWDIRSHGGEFSKAIDVIRAWLASHGLTRKPVTKIVNDYMDFQEWDYERLLAEDWQDSDIQGRATPDRLAAMHEWIDAGRPATF